MHAIINVCYIITLICVVYTVYATAKYGFIGLVFGASIPVKTQFEQTRFTCFLVFAVFAFICGVTAFDVTCPHIQVNGEENAAYSNVGRYVMVQEEKDFGTDKFYRLPCEVTHVYTYGDFLNTVYWPNGECTNFYECEAPISAGYVESVVSTESVEYKVILTDNVAEHSFIKPTNFWQNVNVLSVLAAIPMLQFIIAEFALVPLVIAAIAYIVLFIGMIVFAGYMFTIISTIISSFIFNDTIGIILTVIAFGAFCVAYWFVYHIVADNIEAKTKPTLKQIALALLFVFVVAALIIVRYCIAP